MSILSVKTEEYAARADEQIEKLFLRVTEETPRSLFDPMHYSITAGGKRLRACLVYAACEMCGKNASDVDALGAGVELIHTYSLIHDDLPCMDNDDYRRGKPSCHRMYGEAYALLAGDGLLSLAFESMLDEAVKRGPSYLLAVREIARGAGIYGMVAGQADDLSNEKSSLPGELKTLKRIHERKTGALIHAAIIAGALAAGAGEGTINRLDEFAKKFGLLFQITDDILDVEGDFETVGKTIGKDAAENKLTYVTLLGADAAKHLAREAADEAVEALDGQQNAEYFIELTRHTLTRNR